MPKTVSGSRGTKKIPVKGSNNPALPSVPWALTGSPPPDMRSKWKWVGEPDYLSTATQAPKLLPLPLMPIIGPKLFWPCVYSKLCEFIVIFDFIILGIERAGEFILVCEDFSIPASCTSPLDYLCPVVLNVRHLDVWECIVPKRVTFVRRALIAWSCIA